MKATFDRQGRYPVSTIPTESALAELLGKPGCLRLNIGRIPLPRIRLNFMYWPPSEQTIRKLSRLMEASLAGKKLLDSVVRSVDEQMLLRLSADGDDQAQNANVGPGAKDWLRLLVDD